MSTMHDSARDGSAPVGRSKRVVVFGVGALGSHLVVFARNTGAEVRLVDFDRVESRNLLSQMHVKQGVGTFKSQATRGLLINLWGIPSASVEVRTVRAVPENIAQLCQGCDLAVDCLDNAAGRQCVQDHARAVKLPLLHAAISADGHVGIVRWDERFEIEREDQAGQATCEDGGRMLPEIALLGALAARSVREFFATGNKIGYLMSPAGVTRT